jgi:hypothetical protein
MYLAGPFQFVLCRYRQMCTSELLRTVFLFIIVICMKRKSVHYSMFPKAMNCMYFVERRLSNCDEKCTIFWTKISQISHQKLYLLSAIAFIKLLLRYNGINRCHYMLYSLLNILKFAGFSRCKFDFPTRNIYNYCVLVTFEIWASTRLGWRKVCYILSFCFLSIYLIVFAMSDVPPLGPMHTYL